MLTPPEMQFSDWWLWGDSPKEGARWMMWMKWVPRSASQGLVAVSLLGALLAAGAAQAAEEKAASPSAQMSVVRVHPPHADQNKARMGELRNSAELSAGVLSPEERSASTGETEGLECRFSLPGLHDVIALEWCFTAAFPHSHSL